MSSKFEKIMRNPDEYYIGDVVQFRDSSKWGLGCIEHKAKSNFSDETFFYRVRRENGAIELAYARRLILISIGEEI